MDNLLIILSVLIMLGTLGIFVYDLKTKKYDCLSFRNLFLLGFTHFFGLGTLFTVTAHGNTGLFMASEEGFQRLFFCTLVFLACFFVAQRLGMKWHGLRRFVPDIRLPVTKLGINLAILALLSASVVTALISQLGLLSAILGQFRSGMAAAAVALATYNLLARRFNPVAWLVFFGALGSAALLSTVGDIGRRALLSVVLAVAWMWFFYSLRSKPSGIVMVKIGVLMVAGFFALVMYASFRGHGAQGGFGRGRFDIRTRIEQFSNALADPKISAENIRAAFVSDAPSNTMFIMENYPTSYPFDPFHGLKFLITNPIPRSVWPGKPIGLGITVQEQLQSPANLGVGILGHGWAEGGILGVVGYAAFFGFFTTAFDNVIRRRVWNPYFLAAVGCSLGNVYALARGETSLFLLQVINSFIGVAFVLYLLKFFLGPLIAVSPPLLVDDNRWAFEPPQEDAYDDYYGDTDLPGEARYDEYPSPPYPPHHPLPSPDASPVTPHAGAIRPARPHDHNEAA